MEILENENSTNSNEQDQNSVHAQNATLKKEVFATKEKKTKKLLQLKNIISRWARHYHKLLLGGILVTCLITIGLNSVLNYGYKKINTLSPDEALLIERQQILESKIKNDLSSALDKIIGQGNHHVGVVAYFNIVTEKEQTISHNPQIVTMNNEAYSSNQQYAHPMYTGVLEGKVSANQLFTRKKGRKEPASTRQSRIQPDIQNDMSIEAMLNEGSASFNMPTDDTFPEETSLDITLPGFEDMDIESISVLEPFDNSSTIEEEAYTDTVPTQNPSIIITKEINKNRIIVDKTISIKELPKIKLENIYISIVVNKDILEKYKITKKELSEFLSIMGGIKEDRGDKFKVGTIPFREQVVDFRHSGVEIRKYLVNLPAWLYILIIISIILGFILPKPIKGYLNIKRMKKIDEIKNKAITENQKKQSSITEEQNWLKRRSEVLELANNNPEAMANVLLDWIDQKDE